LKGRAVGAGPAGALLRAVQAVPLLRGERLRSAKL
jgi:hypothetical protein